MSETATEETVQTDPEPGADVESPAAQQETETPAEAKEPDWKADAEKWKSLSRRWERDAKANATAAQRLAEIEDAQKTEQQRLADRLAEAEQRAAQAEIGRARLLAAATYNLPANLLDRVVGGTEDEINESAQALSEEIERAVAERLAAAPAPPPLSPVPTPAPTRPVESLTPGAMPTSQEPADGNAFLRRMAGRT